MSKYTNKVSIFDRSNLIVPISNEHHFSLLVFCNIDKLGERLRALDTAWRLARGDPFPLELSAYDPSRTTYERRLALKAVQMCDLSQSATDRGLKSKELTYAKALRLAALIPGFDSASKEDEAADALPSAVGGVVGVSSSRVEDGGAAKRARPTTLEETAFSSSSSSSEGKFGLDELLTKARSDCLPREDASEFEVSPFFVFFDSARGTHDSEFFSAIMLQWVVQEWIHRKNAGLPIGGVGGFTFVLSPEEVPVYQPPVSQQENGFDCGIYALRYARELMECIVDGRFPGGRALKKLFVSVPSSSSSSNSSSSNSSSASSSGLTTPSFSFCPTFSERDAHAVRAYILCTFRKICEEMESGGVSPLNKELSMPSDPKTQGEAFEKFWTSESTEFHKFVDQLDKEAKEKTNPLPIVTLAQVLSSKL